MQHYRRLLLEKALRGLPEFTEVVLADFQVARHTTAMDSQAPS